jgi:hypothetical protein
MIPGYAEAILEERRRRNRAEHQIPDTVCGVELRPLTLADISILQEAGVSFFDDSAEAHDAELSLVLLLWWQWVKRPKKPRDGLKRAFANMVARVPLERAENELADWIDWQFADAPPTKSSPLGRQPPLTSFSVAICDAVATRCSWPRSEIMALPLPVLWQHIKIAMAEMNPSAPRFNPSDRVKTEFLKSLNQGRN